MKSGTKVGSPLYMAPQVLLEQKYTIKCDVWSLGVIFYEMWNKRLPFCLERSIGEKEIVKRVIGRELEFEGGEAEAWVREMLRGMLRVEEEERWSMARVMQVLEERV
jgi:serine/threonine protein kinase